MFFVCFRLLHLAKQTNTSYQQQGASYTADQTVCATKHAAVAAACGQDLRSLGRLVGSNTKEDSGSVSVVVSYKNQFPHSCASVCANSRARYQAYLVFNSTYTTSRNRVPCQTQGRGCQSIKAGSSSAGRARRYPQARKPSCLSVAVAGHLGKPLSPAPSIASPGSPLICPLRRARTDSNLRGGGPHPCGCSLLHACLDAAVAAASYWWYGVCFDCWLERYVHVCPGTGTAGGTWCV